MASVALSCGCRSVHELLCGEDSSELPSSSPYLVAVAPDPSEELGDSNGSSSAGELQQTERLQTSRLPSGRGLVATDDARAEPEAQTGSGDPSASSQGDVSSGTFLDGQVSAEEAVANSNRCHANPSNGQSAGEGMKVLFESGLLKPILLLLKNKLSRDRWKRHPTAKHALVWCLRHLKVILPAVQ